MFRKYIKISLEMTLLTFAFGIFLWLGTQLSFAQDNSNYPKISNGKKVRSFYDLSQIRNPDPSEANQIRIAVIDREFAPDSNSTDHGKFFKGQLPSSTVYKNFEISNGASLPGNHGTVMAQIVWEMFSKNEYGPKLFLLKTSSHYRSLDSAVDFAIKNNVKIILHSHNHLFGSNFNGVGVYDNILKKARNAGIIWVNSVGNEQKTVFSQPVLVNASNEKLFVNLPDSGDSLKFRVLPLKDESQKNQVRIVLSWNDFPTNPSESAHTDLDLRIYNQNTHEYFKIQNRAQVEGILDIDTNEPLRPSSLAKEEFTAELEPGDYSISVMNRSQNFTNESLLQIVVSSAFKGSVFFIQPQFTDRVLYPADSQDVIAVGDKNTSFGTTTDVRRKPDLVVGFSQIELSDANSKVLGSTEGSSNSAAIFAGILGRFLLEKPELSLEDLKLVLNTMQKTDPAKDLVPGGIPIWTTPSVKELNSILAK